MSDIITAIDTTYGRIRLLIGDTEQDHGILPGGRNFLDAELQIFYDSEAEAMEATTTETKKVGRAAAAAAEAAVSAWASYPFEEMLGPHRVKIRSFDHWQKQAATLRGIYGSATRPQAFQSRLGVYRTIQDAES